MQEVHCGMLDASGGRTILQAIDEYLYTVMMPALKEGQKWGSAVQTTEVEAFMGSLNSYVHFLKSA